MVDKGLHVATVTGAPVLWLPLYPVPVLLVLAVLEAVFTQHHVVCGATVVARVHGISCAEDDVAHAVELRAMVAVTPELLTQFLKEL